MQALQVIISGMIALGVLVFVHELGHFLVAKASGIRVLKFSLGFGRTLVGFKHGETEYVISALPLGGYVKMAGENPKDDVEPVQPGDYFSRPWWVRLMVLLAGPLMNLITAMLVLGFIFWVGFMVPVAKPQITVVEPNSPAVMADMQPGDVITALEQKPVEDWEKFGDQVNSLGQTLQGRPFTLTFMRQGREMTRSLNPVYDQASGHWRLGVTIAPAGTNVIDRVFIGTPAESAGLKKGDRVLFVEKEPVWTKFDFQKLLWPRAGQPTHIVVERNPGPQRLEVVVKPIVQQLPEVGKVGVIGVNFKISDIERHVRYPFGEAFTMGYHQTTGMCRIILTSLWQMVTGQISAKDSVGGPITIMRMAGQEAKSGLKDFLFFIAGISVMLAVVNLLPIPVLDGGNALFFILEGILRKPLSMKIQDVFQRIGFSLLIALMIFATYNDLYKLIAPVFGVKH
jgi:regulator of sigma E protease